MCGIIGVIGKREVAPLLVDGLRRLEYRGYDSAGVATLVEGRIEGAFALAILFAGHPDLLICARRGSPLAIGFGDGEMYLGSDSLALAPLTRRILYLNEGDWAVVTAEGAEVFDAAHKKVVRQIKETALTRALIGKGNHRHYLEN